MLISLFLKLAFQNVALGDVQTLQDRFGHLFEISLCGNLNTVKKFTLQDFGKLFPVDDFIIVQLTQKPTPLYGLLNVADYEQLDLLYAFFNDFLLDFLVVDFLNQGSFIESLNKVGFVLNRVENVVHDSLPVVIFLHFIIDLAREELFDTFQDQIEVLQEVELSCQLC